MPQRRFNDVSRPGSPAGLVMEDRIMPDQPDVVSFAELAEPRLEAFRAQLQVKLSRLGLPGDRLSITALGAAIMTE